MIRSKAPGRAGAVRPAHPRRASHVMTQIRSTRSGKETDATIPGSGMRRFRRCHLGVHHGSAALRTARRGYRQTVGGLAIRSDRRAQRTGIRPRGTGQRSRARRHLHRLWAAGQQLRHPRRRAVAATGRRIGVGHHRHLGAAPPAGGVDPDLGRRRPVPRHRANDHAQQGHRDPQPPASGVGRAVSGRDDLGDVDRRRARHGEIRSERAARWCWWCRRWPAARARRWRWTSAGC